MTLIRKPAQLEVPQFIKGMIYGQAGMGKTTLALSAPKPLLLDFDGGVHRVNYAHQVDTVQIRNWNEAMQVLREDLSAYETIVVDTIGKMMDYIMNHVASGGIPQSWKDWNNVNAEFKNFTRGINMMNKHIIFVAHRDTRKEGDETVFIPALREKNYTDIVTELDLLGYVVAKGNKRTITFNPTSTNDGKNTCNLPGLMNIPTVVDPQGKAYPNKFFTDQVITPYVTNLQKRMENIQKYEIVVAELKENIALITDERDANDFIARIDAFEHVGNSKAVASKFLADKARELGLILKDKKYEKAAA